MVYVQGFDPMQNSTVFRAHVYDLSDPTQCLMGDVAFAPMVVESVHEESGEAVLQMNMAQLSVVSGSRCCTGTRQC
jgi:hypothetical protein